MNEFCYNINNNFKVYSTELEMRIERFNLNFTWKVLLNLQHLYLVK